MTARWTRLAVTAALAATALTAIAPEAVAGATCLGRRVTIRGSGGDDVIRGTRRADVILARDGEDLIFGIGGNDRICGGPGPDLLLGGGGADQMDGGTGLDTISFFQSGQGVRANLETGRASGEGRDSFDNAEALEGTRRKNDELIGSPRTDFFFTWAGNDTVTGKGSGDLAFEFSGDDSFDGGPGNDLVSYFYFDVRGVTTDLNAGTSTGAGNDTLISVESFEGTILGDVASGTDGVTILFGGSGADMLSAGGGDDELFGLLGDDTLLGDEGDDLLNGGPGTDDLDGGADTDECLNGENVTNCEVLSEGVEALRQEFLRSWHSLTPRSYGVSIR
jgi:Ca2+-binding RTX toxin-like protein